MATSIAPIIVGRNLNKLSPLQKPIQSWVQTLSQVEDQKIGIVDLHPSVFGVSPRLDLLHASVMWQLKYKKIDYTWIPTRAEMPGRNKKPWPQKGMGKARHGSRLAPQWQGGGVAHGPRGPKSFFYMQPFYQRVLGLCTALTVKFHQNNLHFVDSLEIPSDNKQYLQQLINTRFWGPSVLFVDDEDEMPYNITAAVVQSRGLTLMPSYGLNVFSMLKHHTVVMTTRSLDKIEERLLYFMHHSQHRGSMLEKRAISS